MKQKQHSKRDWQKFFPFSEPRAEQERAINFILDAFASGKKFVCADLATGIGKSAIAVTVSRYLRASSYILTTQKILQDQYDNDFGEVSSKKLLRTIKSSANYKCSYYCEQSCGDSKRFLKSLNEELKDTEYYKHCMSKECVYVDAKSKFLDANLGVTNFAYFLNETMYAGALEPRELLVIDEAHNIEQEMSKHVQISFSERFAKHELGLKKFPANGTQQEIYRWIADTYAPAVRKQILKTEKAMLECYHTQVNEAELEKITRKNSMLDKHICKVNRFLKMYDEQNWVLTISKNQENDRKLYKKIEIKPVDISKFADEQLFSFSNKVLMMSATIIYKDGFCRSVGLKPEDVAYLNIPSPFPKANRMVHVLPVGKMSFKNIDATLPSMTVAVEEIMKQHQNDKGLIHCVSFKVAHYLIQSIKSTRLLTHNSENRDSVLLQHKLSSEPTVLISPSMAEGVDLADDASRFQILCKLPFPPLNDELVKKRMKLDPEWYGYQTLKTIIQSLGRSIRNENDYAMSYILDEDWLFFRKRNQQMFSDDFLSILC